jgi:regulator of ribonuclease activity A
MNGSWSDARGATASLISYIIHQKPGADGAATDTFRKGWLLVKTTDLCDRHGDEVAVAAPGLRGFGARAVFGGEIATVRVLEDNAPVRQLLSEPGWGRVLVVDGGGSLRCALVGDQLAALGAASGWSGVIVNGCVRDSADLAGIPFGVVALACHPRRGGKTGAGERDLPVTFAGVTFTPGHYAYADADGVIVAPRALA